MESGAKKRTLENPEIIFRDKKPVSVIIDIDEYNKLIEKLEDMEDVKYIKSLDKDSLSFRKFEDILKEENEDV